MLHPAVQCCQEKLPLNDEGKYSGPYTSRVTDPRMDETLLARHASTHGPRPRSAGS
jgi:hypothetical protein